jgi:superfamily II DNA or RNA helicase
VVTLQRPLRAWQEDALAQWRPTKRGVAHVVTGAGKTVLALACIADFSSGAPNAQVLVLVPTIALMDQWALALQDDLGVPTSEIARYPRRARSGPAWAHVMVMNTARRVAPELMANGRWMLIVDECHRVASLENRRALAVPPAAALGLSATPFREYDDYFQEYVAPVLGDVFYSYPYERALKDGVLTPFAIENYSVPLTSHEQREYDQTTVRISRAIARGETRDDPGLKRLLIRRASISQRAVSRIPAAVTLVDKFAGRRAIVFHESIEAATEIAERLRTMSHRVALYHSGQGAATRMRSLALFRRKQVDVLVTCRALDEGLDVPDAQIGVIASSTASTRQRIQRMGRILRPAPGKDAALVCTLYATSLEENRLVEEEAELEGLAGARWFSMRAP